MSFVSIKWKLSIAFVTLTIAIVGVYVLIAKTTFESDKISYIFDTQSRRNEQAAQSLNQQVLRVLFDARAILSSYDSASKRLTPAGEAMFNSQSAIIAIELLNSTSREMIARIAKPGALLPPLTDASVFAFGSEPRILPVNGRLFTVSVLEKSGAETFIVKVTFEFDDPFKDKFDGEVSLVATSDRIVFASDSPDIDLEEIQRNVVLTLKDKVEATFISEIGGSRYLVSSAPLNIGELKVMSFVQEDRALSALRLLFRRSAFFLLFSFFATVVLSLLLSNSLTRGLMALKKSAELIGQGDFSVVAEVASKDEVGVLANAFQIMKKKIEILLAATAEKTRMEAELRTARLVQDNLFPRESEWQKGRIRLAGFYKTMSECGGDWWYYYSRGRIVYVVIADATGHGTPAALITASARSLFSLLQDLDLSLVEIATHFDEALYQCSNGRICMTALILKINVDTCEIDYVNASHEPPVVLRYQEGQRDHAVEHLVGKPGSIIGARKLSWAEHRFVLGAGEKLVLFTDGLTSIENGRGKSLGERRFMKIAVASAQNGATAARMVSSIAEQTLLYGEGRPIPDDLTLVVVERLDEELTRVTG